MATQSNPGKGESLSVSIDALLADDVGAKDLAQRLFSINYQRTRAHDPELAKMMRACAIPSRFDAKTIGILRGSPREYQKNKRLLEGLKKFSFVQTRSDGYYVYHDNTRDVVLHDWQVGENHSQLNRYKRKLLKFYLAQGQQYHSQKKYTEALAEFNRALEMDSEDGEASRWLGMAHFELQDYNSALSALNKAIELQPKESANYYWRATTLYYFKQFPEALADFKRAIKLDAKDGHNLYGRGWTYYQLGDYKAALKDFSKAIELSPRIDYFRYGRGWAHYQLRDYKAALKDFSKAIELNPKDGINYYGRGVTYHQLSDYKAALVDLTKAVKLQPKDSLNYHWRGTTRFELQDYRGAITDITQAIKLSPESGLNYYWRGLARYLLKRHKAASSDFSKAIELTPDIATNYHFRALCFLHDGDYADALKSFNRADELESERKGHVLFWRGVTHKLQADGKKAEADFRRAVSSAKAREDACDQGRIFAKVALLKGEVDTSRQHYEQILKHDCRITRLLIEDRYLDELSHLFPSHADIRTMKSWFKSQLKRNN